MCVCVCVCSIRSKTTTIEVINVWNLEMARPPTLRVVCLIITEVAGRSEQEREGERERLRFDLFSTADELTRV